jgi:hypothetical protein
LDETLEVLLSAETTERKEFRTEQCNKYFPTEVGHIAGQVAALV